MSVLKDGSTKNTDGIDETPSFPSQPSLGPQHLKTFTCCCLEYSIINSQGTLGVGLGEKEKAYNCTSKPKGIEKSQKYPNRADPPGYNAPHV